MVSGSSLRILASAKPPSFTVPSLPEIVDGLTAGARWARLAVLVEVRVGVGQRFENRYGDIEDCIVRQPPTALTKGQQQLGEADPVDVLEDQNELLVVLEEVVGADDVGVIELGADRRLTSELLDDVAVFGRRVRDELEHDFARVPHGAFFARNETTLRR